MASRYPYACGHARPCVSTYLGSLTPWALEHEICSGRTLTERGMAADELASRARSCPACSAADRRLRRAWLWLALAAAGLLLVGWRAHFG